MEQKPRSAVTRTERRLRALSRLAGGVAALLLGAIGFGLITGNVKEPFGFGSSRANVAVGAIALIMAGGAIVSAARRRR